MPNWCRNQITIESKDKKLMRRLNNDLEDMNGKGLLHYMYPMPHELRNTTSGSHSVTNQEFIDKYGFDNWYDWALHNWDTKWDVDFELDFYDDDCILLEFNSAWGPPMGAVQKFVDRYPKGTFEVADLQYIESGCQFCGVYDALDNTNSVHVDDYVSNNTAITKEWLLDELKSELEYLEEEEEK
tara:strand:- start:181 stop:732 length:552 start_codon:yes stop_codon:yes gene_type:complete